MHSTISRRASVLILGAIGIVFSSLLILFLALQFSGQGARASTTVPGAVLDTPLRLSIPVIGLDTRLESVGLTPEGAMDVPTDPSTAAWFDLSPAPGEVGSAVIAGHFGWRDGIPAVFDNLSLLRKGDIVSVQSTDGRTTQFMVREIRTYDAYADAASVFYSSDGKAHLNLITCEGAWNPATKTYSNRLVVFTDKI